MKPALIIDNWAIFADGRCRKLSLVERWRWWRGTLKTVKVGSARHLTGG